MAVSRRKNVEEAQPHHKVKKEKSRFHKFLSNPLVILVLVVLAIVFLVGGTMLLSQWLSGS